MARASFRESRHCLREACRRRSSEEYLEDFEDLTGRAVRRQELMGSSCDVLTLGSSWEETKDFSSALIRKRVWPQGPSSTRKEVRSRVGLRCKRRGRSFRQHPGAQTSPGISKKATANASMAIQGPRGENGRVWRGVVGVRTQSTAWRAARVNSAEWFGGETSEHNPAGSSAAHGAAPQPT